MYRKLGHGNVTIHKLKKQLAHVADRLLIHKTREEFRAVMLKDITST